MAGVAGFDALPTPFRETLVLRDVQGLDYREIAEVTGVPENTVKSRMRYALEGLRERLEALGVGPKTPARSASR